MRKFHVPKNTKILVSFCITLVILALIYSRVDFGFLERILISVSPFYLCLALAMFLTHFFLASWRWRIITRQYSHISIFKSFTYIIACSPLNLLIPAKGGSFAKAYFMNRIESVELKPAISMVFYERASDVAALCAILVFSSLSVRSANILTIGISSAASIFLVLYLLMHFIGPKYLLDKNLFGRYSKARVMTMLQGLLHNLFLYIDLTKKERKKLLLVNIISLAIWINTIVQFIFFFRMFHFQANLSLIFLYIPCAIFIGILPISICGIGTRDAAIIYLFSGVLSYGEAVTIGLTATLRYLLSAAAGIPFLNILMLSKKISFSQLTGTKKTEPVQETASIAKDYS